MKIEKREVPHPKPPVEYVLTLSEEEARLLCELSFYDFTIPNAVMDNGCRESRDSIYKLLKNLRNGIGSEMMR